MVSRGPWTRRANRSCIALDAYTGAALAGISIPLPLISITAIAIVAVIAAGKLAQMSFAVDRLEREKLNTTFRNAPLISWTDVRCDYRADGAIYVSAWCENSGPSESITAYIQAGAITSRGEIFAVISPLRKWHPIKSHKLGDAHKFKVEMLSQIGCPTGEREVRWVMTYTDRDQPTIAYLVQASFLADFREPGEVPIPEDTMYLDASSTPRHRHEIFLHRRATNDLFGLRDNLQLPPH